MKKLFVFTLLMTIFLGAANAAVSSENNAVTGEWKFEVPDAPYGYQKGTMIFQEKEGKLTGFVKFEDGYKIDLKKVSYAEGILKSELYIDYERITTKFKVDGKKIAGTVDTPQGEMKVTAKKTNNPV